MKKVISIICITLLVALYSCDERDDLRSDIDNLKERVANLEASIEQMNSDISNYQQMVEGKILVVGRILQKINSNSFLIKTFPNLGMTKSSMLNTA